MASWYWSSSTNANNTNNAWVVNFNNGNDNNNNKTNSRYVRAVRGGKYSLLSVESIYTAYLDCRKRKRGTVNAIRFEYDVLDRLFSLATALQSGTYQPSRSVCFITRTPKVREIFAADFGDRVIHHLVVRELEKYWEKRFIHDSYACRIQKGTHAAVKRLQSFMMKVSKSRKIEAYFLQLDIRSFFMSIDKHILFTQFKNSDAPPQMLELLHRIIFHDCTQNYYFRGDRRLLKQVPPHKSLFKTPPDKGLPIGNLTSQFFANVYLNSLDQFVKHVLKCRYYIRYVDDFLLLSADPGQLADWRQQIEVFLKDNLALEIKPGSMVRRVSEGADFLGYIVRPDYILVRRRVVNNLKYKLALFRDKNVSEVTVNGDRRFFKPDCRFLYRKTLMEADAVCLLRQTINSYLGHFGHASSHRLISSLFARHDWLSAIFRYDPLGLHIRHAPKTEFRRFNIQVRFFRKALGNTMLFFKMGRFVELYDQDAEALHRLRGGELHRKFRGMRTALGFPVKLLNRYLQTALSNGYAVAVLEEGPPGKWIRHRFVRLLYLKVAEQAVTNQVNSADLPDHKPVSDPESVKSGRVAVQLALEFDT